MAMSDDDRQRLRAEYLRGDVDYLHVINTLEQHMMRDDAHAMADRWRAIKQDQRSKSDGV